MKENCEELSPSPVMLRILSQYTVTNNECYQKKSTLPYKKTQKTQYWDDRGEIYQDRANLTCEKMNFAKARNCMKHQTKNIQ